MAHSSENSLMLVFWVRAFQRRDCTGLGQQPPEPDISGRLASLLCVVQETTVPRVGQAMPGGITETMEWGGSRKCLCQQDASS